MPPLSAVTACGSTSPRAALTVALYAAMALLMLVTAMMDPPVLDRLLQKIDGVGQHGARCRDHVHVGLVGPLGLAHVHQLDQRVHVGRQDIAAGIGGGMIGLI